MIHSSAAWLVQGKPTLLRGWSTLAPLGGVLALDDVADPSTGKTVREVLSEKQPLLLRQAVTLYWMTALLPTLTLRLTRSFLPNSPQT